MAKKILPLTASKELREEWNKLLNDPDFVTLLSKIKYWFGSLPLDAVIQTLVWAWDDMGPKNRLDLLIEQMDIDINTAIDVDRFEGKPLPLISPTH